LPSTSGWKGPWLPKRRPPSTTESGGWSRRVAAMSGWAAIGSSSWPSA